MNFLTFYRSLSHSSRQLNAGCSLLQLVSSATTTPLVQFASRNKRVSTLCDSFVISSLSRLGFFEIVQTSGYYITPILFISGISCYHHAPISFSQVKYGQFSLFRPHRETPPKMVRIEICFLILMNIQKLSYIAEKSIYFIFLWFIQFQ